MRIVQTSWSAGQSWHQYHFGWKTPQHHLMGWALSCLTLREFYDDVHLYTDSGGYEMLVNQLGLPYSKVDIVYDSLKGTPGLWAIPKLLTYHRQEEPFLHVDGDVFIWQPFGKELEAADLVAQNVEVATKFYRENLDPALKELSYLPPWLSSDLEKNPLYAYNAGILGGRDLHFIRSYVQTALDFVKRNFETGSSARPYPIINVLFEQMLLASLVKKEGREVTCLIKETMDDNGYWEENLTGLPQVPFRLKYIHLLGTHKSNKENCDQMSRTLLRLYPDYYFKIVELFRKDNRRFHGPDPVEEDLVRMEIRAGDYYPFFFLSREEQLAIVLERNDRVEIKEEPSPVAVLPELLLDGWREVELDGLAYNILALLEGPMSFQDCLQELEACFTSEEWGQDYETVYKLILMKVKYLFHHKCIWIHANNVIAERDSAYHTSDMEV